MENVEHIKTKFRTFTDEEIQFVRDNVNKIGLKNCGIKIQTHAQMMTRIVKHYSIYVDRFKQRERQTKSLTTHFNYQRDRK